MQGRYPPIRPQTISKSIKRSPFPLLPQSRGAAGAAPTQAPPLRPVAQLQECKRPKATRFVAPESKRVGILLARLRWQRLGLSSGLGARVDGVHQTRRPILLWLSGP